MARLNNAQTRQYMREYRAMRKGRKVPAKRPSSLTAPLSPAMQHLAQFDPIIANRLRRERGEPEELGNLRQYSLGAPRRAQKEEGASPPPPKSSSEQDH